VTEPLGGNKSRRNSELEATPEDYDAEHRLVIAEWNSVDVLVSHDLFSFKL
jgi:hypothetical protein